MLVRLSLVKLTSNLNPFVIFTWLISANNTKDAFKNLPIGADFRDAFSALVSIRK
jgi:hypothetical protein